MLTDLTGPLPTRHSTEMPQEQHERAAFGPPVAEAMLVAVWIDECVIGQSRNVEAHDISFMTVRAKSSRPDVS